MADRALLVGINKYPGCPLNGCVNDIKDMVNYLVKFKNFDSHGIQLLVDERATTANIWSRLKSIVEASRSGDRVLFHYSGHGAQVPTHNAAYEVDGLDEVICPVDFDWSDTYLIRDKQFHQLFSTMHPGVKFNWISDSCHSGNLSDTREMGNPHKVTARAYPIPADIEWHVNLAKAKGHAPLGMSKALVKGKLDVGFISGCQSNQTSADAYIDNRYNGALTYYLLQALKAEGADKAPLTKIVATTNASLRANRYEQEPQAEGARVKRAFLS